MRVVPCLSLLALVAASCQRAEPPRAETATSGAAGASSVPSATAGTAGAGGAPRCMVALPSEPLAQQSPASDCPPDAEPNFPELGRGYVTFQDAPGAPRIGVEIADSEAERSRGLMYRTSLPEEQGMLFSWSQEQVRSFWMRNTCIPLDMLFITHDGFIAGILEQVPVMNEASRSVACPVAYVLEVNAGYCRSHGIAPGGKVVFE